MVRTSARLQAKAAAAPAPAPAPAAKATKVTKTTKTTKTTKAAPKSAPKPKPEKAAPAKEKKAAPKKKPAAEPKKPATRKQTTRPAPAPTTTKRVTRASAKSVGPNAILEEPPKAPSPKSPMQADPFSEFPTYPSPPPVFPFGPEFAVSSPQAGLQEDSSTEDAETSNVKIPEIVVFEPLATHANVELSKSSPVRNCVDLSWYGSLPSTPSGNTSFMTLSPYKPKVDTPKVESNRQILSEGNTPLATPSNAELSKSSPVRNCCDLSWYGSLPSTPSGNTSFMTLSPYPPKMVSNRQIRSEGNTPLASHANAELSKSSPVHLSLCGSVPSTPGEKPTSFLSVSSCPPKVEANAELGKSSPVRNCADLSLHGSLPSTPGEKPTSFLSVSSCPPKVESNAEIGKSSPIRNCVDLSWYGSLPSTPDGNTSFLSLSSCTPKVGPNSSGMKRKRAILDDGGEDKENAEDEENDEDYFPKSVPRRMGPTRKRQIQKWGGITMATEKKRLIF